MGTALDLEERRRFTVFADTEHVTEAAQQLGIEQPTLSRALARLESHAGVPSKDWLRPA